MRAIRPSMLHSLPASSLSEKWQYGVDRCCRVPLFIALDYPRDCSVLQRSIAPGALSDWHWPCPPDQLTGTSDSWPVDTISAHILDNYTISNAH